MASKEALEAALRAAIKAKNPYLCASIRAAMRGEDYDPFEGLSLHPELDEIWNRNNTDTSSSPDV